MNTPVYLWDNPTKHMSEIGDVSDSGWIVSVSLVNNFVSFYKNNPAVVMPTDSHTRKFSLLLHLTIFMFLYCSSAHSLSLHLAMHENSVKAAKVIKHHCNRHVVHGKAFKANVAFTCTVMGSYFSSSNYHVAVPFTYTIRSWPSQSRSSFCLVILSINLFFF